jgi:hypothetical protein
MLVIYVPFYNADLRSKLIPDWNKTNFTTPKRGRESEIKLSRQAVHTTTPTGLN